MGIFPTLLILLVTSTLCIHPANASDRIAPAQKSVLLGDSRLSKTEWNEFFTSQDGLFQPQKSYKVSFDYKVIARDHDARFYALLRNRNDGGGKSVGWTEWRDKAGQQGHVEMAFNTQDLSKGVLILGIERHGAVEVKNISILPHLLSSKIHAIWPTFTRTWTSKGNTTYYVDSVGGNDNNSGVLPTSALQNLKWINRGIFAPGDKILFKCGGKWNGALFPLGSGAAGNPITISSYGTGPKPAFNAAGQYLTTVFINNSQYWDIGNLDISNTSATPIPNLTGLQIGESNVGTVSGIHLHDLTIHDISGSDVKSEGGGTGISCSSMGTTIKTRFDNLIIENCTLTHVDRDGITMSAYYQRALWPLSTNVIIRNNLLQDIGGDGIVAMGCDGCLIAYNTLNGGRQRAPDYACGIWPWSCDNTIVEHNEVSNMKGTNDGEAFDSDYNCRNSTFQYNFSHDNEGGFMLICNDGSQTLPWNIGNTGTVVRYNLSVNDGQNVFALNGPISTTKIYNNVIYTPINSVVSVVNGTYWGSGWPDNTYFANNIFLSAGEDYFDLGSMTNTLFEYNSYWGNLVFRPTDKHAILVNPKLAAPGSAGSSGYSLKSDSALHKAGKLIPNNGGFDYWGNAVSATGIPDVGAGSIKIK